MQPIAFPIHIVCGIGVPGRGIRVAAAGPGRFKADPQILVNIDRIGGSQRNRVPRIVCHGGNNLLVNKRSRSGTVPPRPDLDGTGTLRITIASGMETHLGNLVTFHPFQIVVFKTNGLRRSCSTYIGGSRIAGTHYIGSCSSAVRSLPAGFDNIGVNFRLQIFHRIVGIDGREGSQLCTHTFRRLAVVVNRRNAIRVSGSSSQSCIFIRGVCCGSDFYAIALNFITGYCRSRSP